MTWAPIIQGREIAAWHLGPRRTLRLPTGLRTESDVCSVTVQEEAGWVQPRIQTRGGLYPPYALPNSPAGFSVALQNPTEFCSSPSMATFYPMVRDSETASLLLSLFKTSCSLVSLVPWPTGTAQLLFHNTVPLSWSTLECQGAAPIGYQSRYL